MGAFPFRERLSRPAKGKPELPGWRNARVRRKDAVGHRSPIVCASGADDALQQSLAAQRGRGKLQRLIRRPGNRGLHGRHAPFEELTAEALLSEAARRDDWRQPFAATGAASASAISPRARCFGRLASARARGQGRSDLFPRVETTVGVVRFGSTGRSAFPNPNDVRRLTRCVGDHRIGY